MKKHIRFIMTPLGIMLAAATPQGLAYLSFGDDEENALSEFVAGYQYAHPDWVTSDHQIFDVVAAQLDDYFCRQRRTFTLTLDCAGTHFQHKAWKTLTQIEYGKTWSYTQQAHALGQPTAVRAVANANRVNPVSIIVPCHRVLGKNGTLTGYSGGLWRKAALLELEQM